MLEKYLKPLVSSKIDTLILGCTHYGILESEIKRIVGKDIKVISEEKIVAKKLKDYLSKHNEIESVLAKNGKREFYSTDLTKKFDVLGSKFFGKKIQAKKAVI